MLLLYGKISDLRRSGILCAMLSGAEIIILSIIVVLMIMIIIFVTITIFIIVE